MKKLLIAASLALGISATSSFSSSVMLTAHAEEAANLSAKFVKALKNGTLPRAKGKIGMTYSTFSKKGPRVSSKYGRGLVDNSTITNLNLADGYGFNKKISSGAKITIIERRYKYWISLESIEKNFGKPFKGITKTTNFKQETKIYKVGKYYLHYDFFGPGGSEGLSNSKSSIVTVGTKKEIMKIMDQGSTYKKLYR